MRYYARRRHNSLCCSLRSVLANTLSPAAKSSRSPLYDVVGPLDGGIHVLVVHLVILEQARDLPFLARRGCRPMRLVDDNLLALHLPHKSRAFQNGPSSISRAYSVAIKVRLRVRQMPPVPGSHNFPPIENKTLRLNRSSARGQPVRAPLLPDAAPFEMVSMGLYMMARRNLRHV